MARRGTPSAERPSSRRSGSSRSSRTPAGSCVAACAPARRSGSCCAAPTTCSSCGGTGSRCERPGRPPPERPPGEPPRTTTAVTGQPAEPSPKAPERPGRSMTWRRVLCATACKPSTAQLRSCAIRCFASMAGFRCWRDKQSVSPIFSNREQADMVLALPVAAKARPRTVARAQCDPLGAEARYARRDGHQGSWCWPSVCPCRVAWRRVPMRRTITWLATLLLALGMLSAAPRPPWPPPATPRSSATR